MLNAYLNIVYYIICSLQSNSDAKSELDNLSETLSFQTHSLKSVVVYNVKSENNQVILERSQWLFHLLNSPSYT
jgi:hypothetical protein